MIKSTGSASSTRVPEHGGDLTYVLITPARNESEYVELTLKSMVRQTHPPVKWVIVSDGSTDGTDDIVKRYAAEFKWIELVRMPERAERHFAGKVNAFNAGYETIKDMRYDIIGSMDADISFDADYFSFVLGKFAENPRLGVGGTPFREGPHQYDYRFTSIEHVSGACQLFRRECYESIGGYVPREIGGIDLVAVITARMKGWQTRSFPEKSYEHHRKLGTGTHSRLRAAFKIGCADYILGGHPLWEIFRSIYQMKNEPLILGGCLRLLGFYWAILTRVGKSVPNDFVAFRRQEQISRLRKFFSGLLFHGEKGQI
ncbi:MAG: glycosyltransferase family 2 protein [Geobacter sp.]|nr:MAG: glycosyltransferase family 2 protein [Geobacter sp.]